MLLMLACRGFKENCNAGDAHDAGLSAGFGENAAQLMLIMLAGLSGGGGGVPGKTQCS